MVSTIGKEQAVLPSQISALEKLIDEFRIELTATGADVPGMTKSLSALNKRFVCYETVKAPFNVYGSLDLVALSSSAASQGQKQAEKHLK
jgi:hypothetical protein